MYNDLIPSLKKTNFQFGLMRNYYATLGKKPCIWWRRYRYDKTIMVSCIKAQNAFRNPNVESQLSRSGMISVCTSLLQVEEHNTHAVAKLCIRKYFSKAYT